VTNVQETERCFWNTKKHADLHSTSLQSGPSLYGLQSSVSSRAISEVSNVRPIKQSGSGTPLLTICWSRVLDLNRKSIIRFI
jgi:hypothetical protein